MKIRKLIYKNRIPFRRLTYLLLGFSVATSSMLLAAPLPLQAQNNSSNPAPTGKTMQDYINERGFYQPNGTLLTERIESNRAAFDMVRDYAYKYAPMAGADPVLVVWWTMVETRAPYDPYTYSNCQDDGIKHEPDYLCLPSDGSQISPDNWQIAYGQQFPTAYNLLDDAFEAVYGDPNNQNKVQQVLQDVISKAGLSHTAPGNLGGQVAGQVVEGNLAGGVGAVERSGRM